MEQCWVWSFTGLALGSNRTVLGLVLGGPCAGKTDGILKEEDFPFVGSLVEKLGARQNVMCPLTTKGALPLFFTLDLR